MRRGSVEKKMVRKKQKSIGNERFETTFVFQESGRLNTS